MSADVSLSYDKTSKDSILRHARRLLNKSLREFLGESAVPVIERSDCGAGKGGLGLLVEEHFFRYKRNNRAEPDFPEAGVEVKTAGMIRRGSRFVPKEPRLSLSMIDYATIGDEKWETSSLLRKSRFLLLMLYLYERHQLPIDHIFKLIDLWTFSDVDLRIIRQDWETIVERVRAGKAHELSEGDTYYLGATTKSDVAATTRQQANSTTRAKPRAFSLKRTYLEAIIAQLLIREASRQEDGAEAIIKAASELTDQSFEQAVLGRFKGFVDVPVRRIAAKVGFSLDTLSKAKFAALARAIMGVRARRIEEFVKAGVVMKTVVLQPNGKPKESMSFPYFRFETLARESWESSTLRLQFSVKFFFVVFQKDDSGNVYFRKAVFWNMPYADLEGDVKKVWTETVRRIRNGRASDLPKQSENRVCHVRPHGRDSSDTLPAPGGIRAVKQCFWLNNSYIAEKIGDR